MKKTIAIHLIKSFTYPLEDIHKLPNSIYTLYQFAPKELYDYLTLGKTYCIMSLKEDVLTKDFIPLLRDFYNEFYDGEDLNKCEYILNEFGQYDTITWELCEHLGYEKAEQFVPYFENDTNPEPYEIHIRRLKIDCTGIILKAIPPEEATFEMLYTLEKELHDKFSSHPLAKALMICVGYYFY